MRGGEFVDGLSPLIKRRLKVKKTRWYLVILSLILLLVCSPMVVLGYIVYESHTTGEYWAAGSLSGVNIKLAQTFTPSVSHNVTAVNLKLTKTGSGSVGTVYADLYATSGGKPTGSSLASGNISGSEVLLNNWVWHEFIFESSYNVIDSTMYAIVLTKTDSEQLMWWCDGDGGYASGSFWKYTTELEDWYDMDAEYGADLVFQELGGSGEAPSVATLNATDIEWNEDFNWFEATLNGKVLDDGGDPPSVGFYYREVGGEWSWAGVGGEYTTDETFDIELPDLEVNETYQFYAYASNDSGSDNGTTENFTCSLPISVPTMLTLSYPIEKGSDNATLYGEVGYSGGSNVTAWFQYQVSGNGTWLTSSNETNLVTGSQFNILIGDLETYTDYDFRAVGLNDEGTGYGGISTFSLFPDVVVPTMETQQPQYIRSTSAYLYGEVVDDGGMNCYSWFQYRKVGVSDWSSTSWFPVTETGDVFNRTIENLTPDMNYEYRAVGKNEAGTGYGEIVVFDTHTVIRTPVMATGNASYIDPASMAVAGEVIYDGGSECQVWFQYRLMGSGLWLETMSSYNVTSGYEVELILFDLLADKYYEYRVIGLNDEGRGYGSIHEFQMVEGQPAGGDGDGDGDGVPWNLQDTSVRWIIVIISMGGCFYFFRRSNVLRVLMPLMVFGLALILGWLPAWVVVLLALGAGLTIYNILSKHMRGRV